MVVIHVKLPNDAGFLFETTCSESNDQLIAQLVHITNLRLRLEQLCGSVRELAQFGPMKPPDQQGIDEIKEQYEDQHIEKGPNYTPDPRGIRTGNGCSQQLKDTMERVCMDAEAAISKDLITRKIPSTIALLQEKLDNIRGATMMAFPMGLPEWDIVQRTIASQEGLEDTPIGQQLLDPSSAELWVAGRDFQRGQTVADRLGRNEKTKVVAKLQKPGAGAPAREPAVSEEERKAMMAHYFKRQEELKKLNEADDDDYLQSRWADPKGLQRNLRGTDLVKAPGIRHG